MSYSLPTLPYTALPCVIITVNNLQASVKFTVHVLAASCFFTVKSMGCFYIVGWGARCPEKINWLASKEVSMSRPQWLSQMRVRLVISRFDSRRVRKHSFVAFDREILSTVILFLPLIQEGQLSVSGERMRTNTGQLLED